MWKNCRPFIWEVSLLLVFCGHSHFLGCFHAIPGVKTFMASKAKPLCLLNPLKSNSQKLQSVVEQIVHWRMTLKYIREGKKFNVSVFSPLFPRKIVENQMSTISNLKVKFPLQGSFLCQQTVFSTSLPALNTGWLLSNGC